MQQQEKMTDVNIATHMLTDALRDRFDVAVVVSGDSDLSPPMEAIKDHHPGKKVVVYFPPHRVSSQLTKAANNALHIRESHLKNQLPPTIALGQTIICKPPSWR
jgi:uncharacterized LabA/DUF88 family protein